MWQLYKKMPLLHLRYARRRRAHEPEVLATTMSSDEENDDIEMEDGRMRDMRARDREVEMEESSEEEELDEEVCD